MRELRVGLIGAGFMGKAHSMAYAAMPMFFWPAPAIPVRAVIAEATEELAAEAAARFGFESSTGDWRRIIDDPTIDIVDIATPNQLHPEMAIAAAGSAPRCVALLTAAGVVNMVAFNYRRTPAVALAKKYIEEGAIGDLLNFRGTYLQDWSADPASPLSWRFQSAIAGSGAVGDIGTHIIDLARYLAGEITSVIGIARNIIPERPKQSGGRDALGTSRTGGELGPVDVDDEMVTMIRFASGAVGSLEATRNAHGRNNFITFEIHGTTGSLYFNYERRDELQVCFADDPSDRRGFRTVYTGPAHPYGEGLWPIPALGIGYGETKIVEVFDLVSAIVNGTSVSPNFEDGYRISLVADAILQSSETAQWVDIDG